MSRLAIWILTGVGAVVVLVGAVLAAVPYIVDTPRVQALIAGTASQAVGRPVKFAGLSVAVLPRPRIVLRDLEVAEDPAFGPVPFLRLSQADVHLRLAPLLALRVELGDFVLKKPTISIVQGADGRLNVASLGATGTEPRAGGRTRGGGGGGAAGAVLGSRVRIEDGVVTYETRARATPVRYRIEGLDLVLTGSPRGALAFAGGLAVKPGDLAVKIKDGALVLNGARALPDAALRGKVMLAGKDVRELVAVAMGPEPAIGGSLTGTLTLGGTAANPRASGEVQLARASVTRANPHCPEPKRRTLDLGTVKVNAVWEEMRLTGRPVTTTVGGGSLSTNLTARMVGGVRADLSDLAIKGVALEKVLVDFLCQGYAVTGPLDLTGRAGADAGDLWHTLEGQGQVRIGPGAVVGPQALALISQVVRVGGSVSSLLRGEVPTPSTTAPFEYDSITATYTITRGVVTTRDLVFTSRALRMTAAGTYALASGGMNLDIALQHGGGELRAKVTGTAASPSISVRPDSVVRGLDQDKVQKGLQDLLKRFR